MTVKPTPQDAKFAHVWTIEIAPDELGKIPYQFPC